eukprot:scaffold285_cov304-Pinguiococcus_pyrenoidosus.AAC.2
MPISRGWSFRYPLHRVPYARSLQHLKVEVQVVQPRNAGIRDAVQDDGDVRPFQPLGAEVSQGSTTGPRCVERHANGTDTVPHNLVRRASPDASRRWCAGVREVTRSLPLLPVFLWHLFRHRELQMLCRRRHLTLGSRRDRWGGSRKDVSMDILRMALVHAPHDLLQPLGTQAACCVCAKQSLVRET